jgi:hypothetical protein
MVESTVERNGETSRERRYYICSMILLATLFADAVRCHWHIENRLHWVLDVIFRARGPLAIAHRSWSTQHGDRPPHGHEPAANHKTREEPQSAPQTGRLGSTISPGHSPRVRLRFSSDSPAGIRWRRSGTTGRPCRRTDSISGLEAATDRYKAGQIARAKPVFANLSPNITAGSDKRHGASRRL